MPKDKAYWHDYWKTPKRRAYIKAYRSNPENIEKRRAQQRRRYWERKQREKASTEADHVDTL